MKLVIWILLGKFIHILYIYIYNHTINYPYQLHGYKFSYIFHSFFYSNYHATCFQVPPRAMKGMSAEDFVEEHLVDKTTDEVRDISIYYGGAD